MRKPGKCPGSFPGGRKSSAAEEASIASAILTYLAAHPGCRDTLEGIIEWWLLDFEISYRVLEVSEALDCLVKDGWVIAERCADGRSHYEINPQKLGQVRRMVGG